VGLANSELRITINSALNIDFKALGDYLGDPVVTTAIVDRMVHHSIIINIEGPSYRMHQSKNLNRSSKKKSANKSKRTNH
jgi:DNA replication protein DnaC